MKISNNILKSSIMAILFTLITTVMMTTLPYAQAQEVNTPEVATEPDAPVVGGIMKIVLTGSASTAPHAHGKIRIFDPNATPDADPSEVHPSCTIPGTSGTGSVWELVRDDDGITPIEYTIPNAASIIKVPFGTGGTVTIETFGSATVTTTSAIWLDKTANGATDNLDFLTTPTQNYKVFTCGYDKDNHSPSPPAGSNKYYGIALDFSTQPLVGGLIIPIDATALLIGGFVSSPLMVLPVLGMAAGATFALLKFQVQRKL